jgi:hypothetical protein
MRVGFVLQSYIATLLSSSSSLLSLLLSKMIWKDLQEADRGPLFTWTDIMKVPKYLSIGSLWISIRTHNSPLRYTALFCTNRR